MMEGGRRGGKREGGEKENRERCEEGIRGEEGEIERGRERQV